MQRLMIALAPFALLLLFAACASFLGYGILQMTGDILPLSKLVSKVTLILLLLSIFPLQRILQLSWRDLGFAPARLFFKQLLSGLGLGLATLLPVLLILVALDVQVWDAHRVWTVSKVLQKIGLALFWALLIGLGEEILFRGLLLSVLRRHLRLSLAIGLCSLYFAALHFLKSKTQIPYAELTPASGFYLMAEAFANWLNPQILNSLVSLFVVGVFLAVLRSRIPASLGWCIGCHAGWVWLIKVSKELFNLNPNADALFLVSQYDGVVGPLVSVWLGAAIGVWLWWSARPGRAD